MSPRFAEVIYETGDKSVVSFEDIEELKAGLAEQHRRALAGEPGSAQDWSEREDVTEDQKRAAFRVASRPAERVKRVLLYDQHPADLSPVGNEGVQPVKAKAVNDLVAGMTDKDGNLNMHQLSQAMRDEVSPVYPTSQGRFESNYKMAESEELKLDFLPKESA